MRSVKAVPNELRADERAASSLLRPDWPPEPQRPRRREVLVLIAAWIASVGVFMVPAWIMV
jgi:hypothetical protein